MVEVHAGSMVSAELVIWMVPLAKNQFDTFTLTLQNST